MLTLDTWLIAAREGNGSQWESMLCSSKHTMADPFLFIHEKKRYLFFELQNLLTMRGQIACKCLDDAQQPFTVCLQEPFHMSYPLVFTQQDAVYMIPETSRAASIRLYRAVRFPFEWQLERVIVDNISAVDTTICDYQGQRWLFTYVNGRTLHIYSCNNDLTNVSLVHTIEDTRHALRPAGHFYHDPTGNLIRPAQDCTGSYGKAILLYQVESLDNHQYQETLIGSMTPDEFHLSTKQAVGCHTYNREGDFEVADIKYRTITPKALIVKGAVVARTFLARRNK